MYYDTIADVETEKCLGDAVPWPMGESFLHTCGLGPTHNSCMNDKYILRSIIHNLIMSVMCTHYILTTSCRRSVIHFILDTPRNGQLM